MGNLQSEVKANKQGKVKQFMKIRGKKCSKNDDISFTGIVPDTEESNEQETLEESKIAMLVTDSWCKVNQEPLNLNDVVSPGAESSSDSVFADPLTSVGFNTEINQCYQSEGEEENFSAVLNSFKLNHYSKSKQDDLSQKLGRLGVCKTSQISLDGAGEENFECGNVEVVKKDEGNYNDVKDEASTNSGKYLRSKN